MKKIVILMMLTIFSFISCNPCRKPEVTDHGMLSVEAKAMVAYEDGKAYRFRHSGGHIVTFTCERKVQKVVDMDSEWYQCWKTLYEEDFSRLIPDYPVPEFAVWIASRDSVLQIDAGYGYFGLHPSSPYPHFKQFDTLRVNDVLYYDVFEFEDLWCNDSTELEKCVTKLLYNYDFGILKVVQNVDEYYELLQD